MTIKTYRELRQLETFEERYEYLKLYGQVGLETFGHERWMNQAFYTSNEWRRARRDVIARDLGCDLGIPGEEIFESPVVHHINPLQVDWLEHGDDAILDPDNLITVSRRTHNAIHYGDTKLLRRGLVTRRPGDTKLW